MRRDDFESRMVAEDIILGVPTEVIFQRIQYREDQAGDIIGAFVHIKDYRALYIPIFEDRNTQLDMLLNQLGIKTYRESEINKCAGTTIIATRYETERNGRTYTNVSFNPNPRSEEVEEFA